MLGMFGMRAAEEVKALRENIKKVFVGRDEVVDMLLVGLLARGHLIIQDLPGVGKTILARALAKSIDSSFNRIQFTPDLLPSDVLGVSVFDASCGEFVFKKGPIFANVVLADEINRTTPRTQSSLLEAMNDFRVSVDGKTYDLPSPFMVIATQNPHETQGTFFLPESQLDRFLLDIRIGYPSMEQERRILSDQKLAHPLESLGPVVSSEGVVNLQRRVREITVAANVVDYLLTIIRRTRENQSLELGASPRAALGLYRSAQALAFLEGRDYCMPDDVKRLAESVLMHRLAPASAHPTGDGMAREALLEILSSVRVPI